MERFSRRFTRIATGALIAAAMLIPNTAIAADGDYIEPHADDPVSTQPEITVPTSKSCTVTLAEDYPSNGPDGAAQTFSGTMNPPEGCSGPWSKIILNMSVSVSGRQYDRLGSITIGDVPIWVGTTQEPDSVDEPTTFSFSKDITRYAALFDQPQQYNGGFINYTNSTYTGIYTQTATITFYEADDDNPAANVPDEVIGVKVPDLTPGSNEADITLPELPRNLTNVYLETTMKGNGCDEQWFDASPDEVVDHFPDAASTQMLCRAGTYREAAIGVDDIPAGAVNTFPHVYSGGIVPTLWRPILALNTLDMRSETLDLTPFAGNLVDGGRHTLNISMGSINDTWNIYAVLLLYTDHGSTQTSGALTRHSAPAASVDSTVTFDGDSGASYTVTGSRNDELEGYVDTSAGRIYTKTSYVRDYRQDATVDLTADFTQNVKQTDTVTSSSVSEDENGNVVRSTKQTESYPLDVDFTAADYTDDNGYDYTGHVRMEQNVDISSSDGAWPGAAKYDWTLDSSGTMARTDGELTKSDGKSDSTYSGTDDSGAIWNNSISTEHGKVVSKDFQKVADAPSQATLTGISVKSMPAKTHYAVGDAFDPTGLVLSAAYSDGHTEDVTDTSAMEFSGFDSTSAGTRTITVSWQGQQTSFVVEIDPVSDHGSGSDGGQSGEERPTESGSEDSDGGSLATTGADTGVVAAVMLLLASLASALCLTRRRDR